MSASPSGIPVRRPSSTFLKWLAYLGLTVAAVAALSVIGILVWQRTSDGPYGPLQGGAFETGDIVRERITDWSFLSEEDSGALEFELVASGTSRTTGAMIHEGDLYIPCDLGYMWGRFEGRSRFMLNVIYLLKHWHTDAVKDGRTILRIDGKLYPGVLSRVTDPVLDRNLRRQLEAMARAWIAPAAIAPPPTEPPNDIWFFRFDSRPEVAASRPSPA